ncbi:MAG: transposase [Candidatus Paceibacterota bacterium]
MSIRNIKLVSDEYFHIYNRGNGKHKIFLDEEDYDRFEKILYICNSEKNFNFRDSIVNIKIEAYDLERGTPLVSILAWVLMPNHFHLFLISPRQGLGEEEKENISKYMQKVSTAYVMYFNKKYKRTGSLFEGKFKAKHINKENYFNYLFAYIHLNCMKLIQSDWKKSGIRDKEKAKNYLKIFSHSSFQDYFGNKRKQEKIINKNMMPKYLKKVHINELFEWINTDLD